MAQGCGEFCLFNEGIEHLFVVHMNRSDPLDGDDFLKSSRSA